MKTLLLIIALIWICCVIFNTCVYRHFYKQAIGTTAEDAFNFGNWFFICVVLAPLDSLHNFWLLVIKPDEDENE